MVVRRTMVVRWTMVVRRTVVVVLGATKTKPATEPATVTSSTKVSATATTATTTASPSAAASATTPEPATEPAGVALSAKRVLHVHGIGNVGVRKVHAGVLAGTTTAAAGAANLMAAPVDLGREGIQVVTQRGACHQTELHETFREHAQGACQVYHTGRVHVRQANRSQSIGFKQSGER